MKVNSGLFLKFLEKLIHCWFYLSPSPFPLPRGVAYKVEARAYYFLFEKARLKQKFECVTFFFKVVFFSFKIKYYPPFESSWNL